MSKSNYFWIGLLLITLIGAFFLFKAAYANPMGLPDFAFTKPAIKEAYIYAITNAEKLTDMPCNCGCMDNAASHGRLHSRGLIDCFMDGDVNNGGKWDMHASECGMCYEDALEVKKFYEEGKSKGEIQLILKEKYAGLTWSNETVY